MSSRRHSIWKVLKVLYPDISIVSLEVVIIPNIPATSMHSSRMRTARLLTLSRSIGGGGVCLGGVYPSMQWVRHPAVNKIIDRCKNITLPQILFASSNN